MIIFDDIPKAFYPICQSRPVSDIRCGILKLRQRISNLFDDDEAVLWIEPRLQELWQSRLPDWPINRPAYKGKLLINSRIKPQPEIIQAIKALQPGESIFEGDYLIAHRAAKAMHLPLESFITKLNRDQQQEGWLFSNLSEIIHASEDLIRQDFEQYFYDKDNFFETEPGVTILAPYSIWIGDEVTLKPGVVLDASAGPIVIDEGATIMHNAVIVGPAYIGKLSVIKIAAKIYPGSSIGPVCKVGGEVEGSIFHAYSNKQHDGFLGHSYVGEWVNIGADTNNSDLKNTYGSVFSYSYLTGKKEDTHTKFMGCIIGDHSKLVINCSINTGTVIGVGSNLWGSALIDGFIPDFSWGNASLLVPHRLESFFKTAALVKQRRDEQFSPEEAALYSQIFKSTHGD